MSRSPTSSTGCRGSPASKSLRSIDDAYHRSGEIGKYRVEPIDDRTANVVCGTAYPRPFDRGLIRAVGRRYAPVEAFVFVEERGDACHRDGADACTYTVSW